MSTSLRFITRAGVTLWALCLMTATALAQPRGSFTAGPLTAKAGEKVSGLIQVPAAADEGTMIPISVLHGAKPGPVLALIAGNHGY